MKRTNLFNWAKGSNWSLRSFDIEVKPTKIELRQKTKKKVSAKVKIKFSTGQIRKLAKKRGVPLTYALAKKFAKQKQSKETLVRKLGQVKAKATRQAKKEFLSGKGANVRIYEYRKQLEAEYKRKPTMSNLKKLQEASLLSQQAKLYDIRYQSFWKDIKANIRFRKEQLQASRHAGNISIPISVSRYGEDWESYITTNYSDLIQQKLEEDSYLTTQEAVELVYQELIADGTLSPLNQYYQVGILYGYIDESTEEIISPP